MAAAPVERHGRQGHLARSRDHAKLGEQRRDPRLQTGKQPATGSGRRRGADWPASQPQRQRAVGDQRHAQVAAHLGHPTRCDRLGGQQRQLHLQAGQAHPLALQT